MSMFSHIYNGLRWLLCGGEPEQPQAPPAQPPSPRPHRPQEQQPHVRPQVPEKPKISPPRPRRSDQNQINQQNASYVSLRDRAREEGAQMARCFQESKAAYAGKDGALAKQLSLEGHAHEKEMERLNTEASQWIYVENNKDRSPGEVDLHGLYVKEAIAHTDRAIQEARQRGDSEIRLIVGKGLHSPHGAAKLEPAVKELMQKHGLVAELDPTNAGVLIVDLDGQSKNRGPVIGPEDIVRRLKKDEEGAGCVVM